jgi:3-oxoacyl-[acyl-carrier-protein] synthase II
VKLAITGADMITSVGSGRAANFDAFCNGVSGDKLLQCFDKSRFRFEQAYEIDDRNPQHRDAMGRASRWLGHCVTRAMQEAELALTDDQRVALLVGTGLRELRSLELWWADGLPFHVSELHFGGALQQKVGCQGPIFTFCNACAASNFALGIGDDLLRLGEADVAIVAGCDSITESMFGTLDRVTATPPERVIPFDRHQKGMLMGEGAAAVVLEPVARAAARGKTPLALLRGVGMSCDAHHETAPDLDGMLTAMSDAHQRANMTPAEVDLIVIHGTGTVLNDQTEALAIKKFFGATIERALVSGLKSMTGHTSGASGLIGVVAAIEAMQQGRVPPTVGFSEPIVEAEGVNIVAGTFKQAAIRFAQVNAFGFGGVNAVVLLEKATP